jgi:hypothetical protein
VSHSDEHPRVERRSGGYIFEINGRAPDWTREFRSEHPTVPALAKRLTPIEAQSRLDRLEAHNRNLNLIDDLLLGGR